MLSVQERKSPGRTRLESKILFPTFCWWYTFGEMRTCVRKKYGKKGTKTSGRKRKLE
jgi:hypothetical protein